MTCPTCQQQIGDNARFCKHCGRDVQAATVTIPTPPMPPVPTPSIPTTPVPPASIFTEDMLPLQYRPLSAWAYFGLSLLFSVPIVGFVFLIVFSFSRGNIHRRSFARSYWCALLVAAIIMLVVVIVAAAAGASLGSLMEF